MRLKHMLKANKNELLSFALAGFLIINTGFTAPHEVLHSEEPPAEIEKTPIVNNAPTAISVSESGSIELADDAQKHQFDLIEPEPTVEQESLAEEPLAEEPIVEEPISDMAIEEPIEERSMVEEVNYVDDVPYSAIMAMEATAYLPTDGNGEGITASGTRATYGVAAVDPSVIPLGSRLYVPGYGEAVAEDTGGAITGYRIDLCMESREQAMAFGRRVITVFVLNQ